MSNEEILREYRDDSKFTYLSQVVYTVNDCFDMLDAARKDEAVNVRQYDVSRLLPSDEQITNAANNHQLGSYEWQAEKRKSFELGAKWAMMCVFAELSKVNNG